MSHPSYSYLTPDALAMALDLARELHRASGDVGTLAYGGAAAAYLFGGGRSADRQVAVQEWIGPHRDTFDLLFANEMDSARTTETRLVDEAEAWAAFWALAVNARNQRLHDEAMARHRDSMDAYRTRVDEYHDAVADDPELAMHLVLPSVPVAPAPPPPVTAPEGPTYTPTG